MFNQVDTLFHITNFENLKMILQEGFKPSYANEHLGDQKIIIPMVSFSNILLRDMGEDEVLNYGEYGIGFPRSWGLSKNINPVIYTYKDGEAHVSLTKYLENSVFLSRLREFKEYFKKWSECKCGVFSSSIAMANTSKEASKLVDYLSTNYDEELVEHLSNYANSLFQATKPVIFLTKPYIVTNKKEESLVAYNDREWRKIYLDLDFYTESMQEYNYWTKQNKPHFNQDIYRLTFHLSDISAILIKNEDEKSEIMDILKTKYQEDELQNVISTKQLIIETKANLINKDF